MAYVATKATGGSAEGGEGEWSLLCRFEAKAAAFGSSEDFFFDELPLRVFTMALGMNRTKKKKIKEKERDKDETMRGK